MTKSVNKIVILLVALLMCLAVVLAACKTADFKPVDKPASATPDSNGGIAVVYGDWLYYVNGYTSDVSAENTYSNDVKDEPRIGSVVRIRLAEIEKILKINDDSDLSSSEKTKKIASAVRGDVEGIQGAETVIPKIYYSGNTTTTQFTGIYIFNDRIYVTTPSDKLTPNGDPMTQQLVLMSFDLGGGDRKEHYTFTSNSAQIWLATDKNGKLYATYLMDSILHTLDVEAGKDTVVYREDDSNKKVSNTVSGVNWDVQNKLVFFLDKFGSICKLEVGQTQYEVIVKNTDYKDHGDHIEAGKTTYTISFVNDGAVYYTVAQGKSTDNVVMYWAKSSTEKDQTALSTNSVSVNAWKGNKLIVTNSIKSGEKTYYSICIVEAVEGENGKTDYKSKPILSYGDNDSSITINKVEGDKLYYTTGNISYVIDLAVAEQLGENEYLEGEARAKSLAATTGWAAPDFVTVGNIHYIVSAASGTVTLTKFDPSDLKATPVSIALTLTVAPAED